MRTRGIQLFATVLPLLFVFSLVSAQEKVIQSKVREEAFARLVQVDISVLKPGSKTYASVPGLIFDHFEVRLDGKPLTPEQRQQVVFEPICDLIPGQDGSTSPDSAADTPSQERPILVVVDFNYVDSRGRNKVAKMLDQLAEHAATSHAKYKIYSITRQVRHLTDDFTSDAAEIRAAAELIRNTLHRGAMIRSFHGTPPDATSAAGLDDGDGEGIPSDSSESFADLLKDSPFSQLDSGNSSFFAEMVFSDIWGDAHSDYLPSASLAALESIMRAHTSIRGRKAVLLFSSEAFRYSRQDRLEMEVKGLAELGRQGFTIWTIDVEGVGRKNSGASELLSMLAQDSGGDSIRNTNNLMRAFKGAEEQLSCYYLFSLPMAASATQTKRHDLTVKLDTTKYKELWGYRVLAPTKLTLLDEHSKLRNQRISALLSPEDYPNPQVSSVIGYPIAVGDKFVLPVQVRVPLKDLTWLPAGKASRARVLVDAVVERDTGRGSDTVCKTSTDDLGILEINLPHPPDPSSNVGLTIEIPCSLKRDGLLTVRGVVTDMETGKSGAGRSSVLIRRKGLDEWSALELGLQASSGRDYVWTRQMKSAVRDRKRQAWRAVTENQPAFIEDRSALRYVLCGPERSAARDEIVHVIIRENGEGAASISEIIPSSGLKLPASEETGSFCSPAMVTLPEFSCEAGKYAFAVLRKGTDHQLALDAFLNPQPTLPEGVLGLKRFEIRP